MFIFREIPDPECLQQLARRYPDMNRGSAELIMEFLRTAADVVDGFERHLTHYGMSQGRFAVMMFLNHEPEVAVNQTHLSDACRVTKGTITGLVDGLERDGLVERLADARDRRASLIRLTAEGRRFIDAVLPRQFQRTSVLLEALSATDRKVLRTLLGKIETGLGRVATLEKKGTLGCVPNVSCRRKGPAPAS